MKVVFLRGAEQGRAEYDPSTEEYSWSYDGDDEDVIELLSNLDDGRVFTDMVTTDPVEDDDGPELVNEGYEILPWDEQIEMLTEILDSMNFKIMYLGD